MNELNEQMFQENYYTRTTINDYLKKGERILWHEKPKAKSYVFSQVAALTPIALIWLIIDGSIIGSVFAFQNLPGFALIFIVGFFALHLMPVWIWLASFFKSYNQIKDTEYYITNNRVIITNFPQSRDIKEINISNIKDVTLSKKGIDKLVRVGDIAIIGEVGTAITLYDITEPEKIYGIFEKVKSSYSNLEGLPASKICEYCGNTINKELNKCEGCGALFNEKSY